MKTSMKVNKARAKRFIYLKMNNGFCAYRTKLEMFKHLKQVARQRGIKQLSFYKNGLNNVISILNKEDDDYGSMGIAIVTLDQFLIYMDDTKSFAVKQRALELGIIRMIKNQSISVRSADHD